MDFLPIVIAILILLGIGYFYKVNAKKNMEQAKKDPNYKVPLSDDVQRIYYENYEKEVERMKQQQEDEADGGM